LAIERVDQRVASAGVCSKVATIKASTWSSPIERGNTRTRFVVQALETVACKTSAPLADRGSRDAHARRHVAVAVPSGTLEHDLAAQRERLGTPWVCEPNARASHARRC
jgi:hypothetical protein